MIFIALGANLPSVEHGSPRQTLEKAIEALEGKGITCFTRSHWYESAPVPPSGQPNYINGVISIRTKAKPAELLAILHEVEAEFGRVRQVRNEARVLDLDLIDYAGEVLRGQAGPELPHPRMQDRSFVLLPLQDIAPDWCHPETGQTLAELVAGLSGTDDIKVVV